MSGPTHHFRFCAGFLVAADDETDHALKRPGDQKRQGTKSRQLGTGWQQALWGLHVGAALDVRRGPQHRTMGISADVNVCRQQSTPIAELLELNRQFGWQE